MDSNSVIIVEDEPLVAVSIAKKLRRMGLDVLGTYESGSDAVTAILEKMPDLILMDIKLSQGEDGIDIAHEIHKTSNIPVIFLTALADHETIRRAVKAEPYSYLVKPFSELELRSNIEIVLHRYELEKRLRESEKRYRIISELSSDFAYAARLRHDNSVELEWMTNAVYAVTGYTKSELHGELDLYGFIPPEEKRRLENIACSVLQGEERDLEHRIYRKNGSLQWVRHRIRPEMQDGRVVRLYGSVEDISEIKRIEGVERAKEQNYKNIIQDMNDGVIILDKQNIITYANNKVCEFTGFTKFELIGEDHAVLIHPEDIRFATIRDADHPSCLEPLEIRLNRKEKSPLHALISTKIFHDTRGNFSGSFWIITNINRQKEKEFSLKREREETAAHYRHIFEVSRTPFLQLDLRELFVSIEANRDPGESNFRQSLAKMGDTVTRYLDRIEVVDANPAALELFQAGDTEGLKQAVIDLLHAADDSVLLECVAELAEGNKHIRREVVSPGTEEGTPVLFDFYVPEHSGGYENILMTINAYQE